MSNNSSRGRARSGRSNQRRRGAPSAKALIHRATDYVTFRPPLRQPTVNRAIVVPLTVSLTKTSLATTSWLIRVEDLIESAFQIVGMTTESWVTYASIKIQSVSAYGLIGSYDKTWAPSFTLVMFNPVTNSIVKSIAAIGEMDDPPRLGFHYPAQSGGQLYSWDGTAGTSANVAGVKTTDEGLLLSVYFNIVLTLNKPISPTVWDSPTSDQLDRSPEIEDYYEV